MKKKKETSRIAINLKKFKEVRGWTQGDLSQRAKLAYHTVAKIEAGSTPDPRINTVKKIADVLGVTLDDLMK